MAETSYINYGKTQSNVNTELKVYYNVVARTATNVTIDIDVGVHFIEQWSSNGCWVRVNGESRSCNPNHTTKQYYWYASSQGNSRSSYWKRVTLSAAAAITSVNLAVGFSNTAFAAGTFQEKSFALTIPVGNTNAYWSNPSCSVSPSGTIPENTKQLTVSWSGAKDDQNDTIYYYTEIWKNGSFTGNYAGGAGTTAKSGTVDISADPQGTTYYFKTYCKDSASASKIFGKQSATVTKNRFTSVSSFNIGSPSVITPKNTYFISCSHNMPQNTNGNTSFTYNLSVYFVTQTGSAYGIPLYGVTSAKLAPSSFNIWIWDGTGSAPTGMYIKQSDIKSACAEYAPSSYTGILRLTMTCVNGYGSSGTISADKTLNWQYVPATPTTPEYSSDSYFTLPETDNPVFLINRRAITWTWDPVTDPNGTAVSYLVYTKTGNNSWVLGKTTTDTTYVTSKTALSQAQKYQIKVVAKFAYGTMSSAAEGPQIQLDYYNQPTITASVIERNQNDIKIKTVVRSSASISNPIGNVNLTYSGLVSKKITNAKPTGRDSFEDQSQFSNLEETTFGDINLTYTDSVMSVIFPYASSKATVTVTQWSALLTIREKGIGINSVAGNYSDFIVKGTASLYGGETKRPKNGNISLSTQHSSGIDMYNGIYIDSEGKYRAAQVLPVNTSVYQIQTYNSNSNTVLPMRWRYMYSNKQTEKDAIFTPSYTSEWRNFSDTELQSHFLKDNILNGLWRKRDCGFWSGLNGTGQLLIPVGTSKTAGDHGQIELSLMWCNNDNTQKIWCGWFTSSINYHYVNGSYLGKIPNTTVKLVWDDSASIKYLCFGLPDTSWPNLRMVNVDLYISKTSTYKPTDMNPILSTSSYTTLGAVGTLKGV